MSISQRAFTTVLIGIVAILVALYAGANHLLPAIDVHDLSGFVSANFLTIITPLTFVLTTLNAFYNSLDQMVTDGTLQPGDIQALFTMSSFYVTVVASVSGLFQVFGLSVINANDQAMLVNVLLLGATVLLRSFSSRAPQSSPAPVEPPASQVTINTEAPAA